MIIITDTRTLDDIITELKSDIMRRNPAICDWSDLSVNLTLAQAYGKMIYDLEQLIYSTADSLFINTATGSDLDKLVVDRLPDGRQDGTKASGQVTFSRTSATTVDIAIPSGTIISEPTTVGPVYFYTSEDVTLSAGDTTVTVDAVAQLTGIDGNAPSNTIIGLVNPPSGIQAVTNPLAFSGGTDEESDDDLRTRYIYAVLVPGKATNAMIEEHLSDLDNVTEAQCFNVLPGVIELVIDTEEVVTAQTSAVETCIIENIAAGIVAHGVVGATIVSGTKNVDLDTCAGGYIYVVVDAVPTTSESITITYTNQDGDTKTATASIPAYSAIGTAIAATMATSSDMCAEITALTYTGTKSYTLCMGLGEYPYLYNLPQTVSMNVTVAITATATPQSDLATAVQESITDFLNAYKIGDDFEFADLVPYIYRDYSTSTAFIGIGNVTSIVCIAKSTSVNTFGESISIDNDERIRAGTVTVNVT